MDAPTVTATSAEVAQAVAQLCVVDAAALDCDELGAAVVEVQRSLTRLTAAHAALVGAWEASGMWRADGAPNASAALAAATGESPEAARRTCGRARKLRTMPHTRAAFLAGELSTEHVDALCRTNRRRVQDLFADSEAELVEQARSLPFSSFTRALRYWSQCADDATEEDKATRHHDDRRVDAGVDLDGRTHLYACLDVPDGAVVRTELDRLEQQLFASDWAEARAVHGDDTCATHLARTPAQRRADALCLMARRSASASPEPSGRPLITVLVDLETFGIVLQGSDSPAEANPDSPPTRPADHPRSTSSARQCELSDGTVLTPGQVRRICQSAHAGVDVERLVFGSRSRVLDVGTRQRLFTGATRRAIEVRDRRCTELDCDVPAERCEVDHIVPFSVGGETTQANGRLLCPHHHRRRDDPRGRDPG